MTENVVPMRRRRRGVVLHRLDQLPERPVREEIVDGLFAAGELIAINGPPGVGKTAFLARLATDVAEGCAFLGRAVSQGSVVYLAGEKARELQRRLLVVQRKPRPPIYVSDRGPNLSDFDDVTNLIAAISAVCEKERRCPVLLIVDTLARSMAGVNEDRAGEVGRVVEHLAAISEAFPTAALLFSHHVTKSSGAMRGSSALLGAVDLALMLTRNAKASTGRVTVQKSNSVDESQTLQFRLVPKPLGHGLGATETVVTVEPLGTAADETPVTKQQPAALPLKSRELLEALKSLAPITRLDALRLARERGLVQGGANATRMAFKRLLDPLEISKLIHVASDVLHVRP